MNGSWHRYRPGERWRRPAGRARLVLEVPGAVAVCFDAPVVELFEQRAEALHPSLGRARAGPARRPTSTPTRRSAACATRSRAATDDRRGAPRPAGARRHRQRLQERDACGSRARLAVRAGRGARRRRRCDRPARAGARGRSATVRATGRRPARRLRPDRPPVPALRDADPVRGAGRRAPADDVLVPALPAGCTRGAGMSVDVRCEPVAAGWTCTVRVDDGDGPPTDHVVAVAGRRPRPSRARSRRPDGPRRADLRLPARARAEDIDPRPLRPDGDRSLLPRLRGRDPAAYHRARCVSTRRPRRGAVPARRAVAVHRAARALRARRVRLGRRVAGRRRRGSRSYRDIARLPRRPGPRRGRRRRDDEPRSSTSAGRRGCRRSTLAGHPAVRRSRRPLRVQPQRRPARLQAPARDAIGPQGRIHGRADTRGRRALARGRLASDGRRAAHLLGALHDRFGGQANLAVLGRRRHAASLRGQRREPGLHVPARADRGRVDRRSTRSTGRSSASPRRARPSAGCVRPHDDRRARPRRRARSARP